MTLLTSLLILNSCHKEEQYIRTKVHGVIKDYYSEQPIANATVGVFRYNTSYDPHIEDTVATTLTNINGEYEIVFHALREEKYVYFVFVNKESGGYNESYFDQIKKRHSNDLSYNVKGRAWLSVHVKNITPFDEHDYIKISAWPAQYGGLEAYGVSVDTNITCYTKGSSYIHLVWYVTKNDIKQYYENTIYCPSLDTTYYTINY